MKSTAPQTTDTPERRATPRRSISGGWLCYGIPATLALLFWLLDALASSLEDDANAFFAHLFTPTAPHLALRVSIAAALFGYGWLVRRRVMGAQKSNGRLRETQKLLRAVIDDVPVLISAYDEKRRAIFWNRECEAVTGYSADEIVGNPRALEILYPAPEQRRTLLDEWRDIEADFRRSQWMLTCKDGTRRTIAWTNMSQRVRLPDWPNWAIGVDVSNLVSAEEELHNYREHLESLVRQRTHELETSRDQLRLSERLVSVGTLAAGIAHEINNPIGAILNSAEFAILCQDDADSRRTSRKAFDEIVVLARRCGRIVKGLLQFSRGEPATKWRNEVNAVSRVAADLTRSYAAEHGVRIELELCSESTPVLMNTIEMEQVLVNLLRNAVEARPKDARIVVRSESLPDVIRIEVADRGDGIVAAELENIFDPFYTTRQEEGGTGLGLSVAHGIVAEHGGRIGVESEAGAGSRITIELPRDHAEAAHELPSKQDEKSLRRRGAGHSAGNAIQGA